MLQQVLKGPVAAAGLLSLQAGRGAAPSVLGRFFASDSSTGQSQNNASISQDPSASGVQGDSPAEPSSAQAPKRALRALTEVLDNLETKQDAASGAGLAGGPEGEAGPSSAQGEEEAALLASLAKGGAGPSGQGAAASPGSELLSQQFGYAALGGYVPRPGSTAHPRVHPRMVYAPGQTYNPEDLNAYAPSGSKARGPRVRARSLLSHEEVGERADFREVALLERFLSPAGKLLPRKQTRLPMSLQKKVTKEIKTARQMGLIAGETRLDKAHLRAVREAEARAYEMRAAGAALAAATGGSASAVAQ